MCYREKGNAQRLPLSILKAYGEDRKISRIFIALWLNLKSTLRETLNLKNRCILIFTCVLGTINLFS